MNLVILIGVIATSAIVSSASEFHSLKSPHWNEVSTPSYQRSERSDQFYEGIFRARVDHFRPQNQDRVTFRYHVNVNHFEPGRPLYIYLKDYRDYSTRWIENGLMVDIARQTRAALLTFDYRYFGQNRPTETASFEDLEFLSVEQILADYAEFIRFVREYVGAGQYSRVILWGSGLGGALAVWARGRYPHLIDAAWSSSGYLESQISSYGPYDLFEYTFYLNEDPQCRITIEEAYDEIAELVRDGRGAELSARLNLCNPVETNSQSDMSSLYELTVRAVASYIDQYHYFGVTTFCHDLHAIPDDPLSSFARWLRYVYGDAECFDHSYDSMVERTSNPDWDEAATIEGRRQFYYLQCTQIGSFLLADDYTWIAGNVSLNFHLEKCEDIFNFDIDFATLYSAFHGLMDEYNVSPTNVIYTNGYLDLFRYFGRMYDSSYNGVVLNMEFAAKSADLLSQTVNDPRSIYDAKSEIIRLVTEWSER